MNRSPMLRQPSKYFFVQTTQQKSALGKAAGFTYVDRYVGEINEKTSIALATSLQPIEASSQQLGIFVAPVARLGGGRGVFASQEFKNGDTPLPIGIYWGHVQNETLGDSSYTFCAKKFANEFDIDGLKFGNWTRFINHKQNGGNLITHTRHKKIAGQPVLYVEFAIKPGTHIKPGDQLLFDYGDEYQFNHQKKIFLNVSDNDLSPQEFYVKNSKHYSNATLPMSIIKKCGLLLGTGKQTFIFPKLFHAAFVDNNLIPFLSENKGVDVDIPLLATDKKNQCLPLEKQTGITALMLASYMGELEVVKILLEYGARPEQQHAATGYTALFYAVLSSAPNEIKHNILGLLLQKTENLTTQDENEYTILHHCVIANDIATLKFLFNKTNIAKSAYAINIISENNNRFCPIMLAIHLGHIEIIQLLIKHCKDDIKFPEDKDTIWFLPTLSKAFETCKEPGIVLDVLMKNGLNKNQEALETITSVLEKQGIKVTKENNSMTLQFPSGRVAKYQIELKSVATSKKPSHLKHQSLFKEARSMRNPKRNVPSDSIYGRREKKSKPNNYYKNQFHYY